MKISDNQYDQINIVSVFLKNVSNLLNLSSSDVPLNLDKRTGSSILLLEMFFFFIVKIGKPLYSRTLFLTSFTTNIGHKRYFRLFLRNHN